MIIIKIVIINIIINNNTNNFTLRMIDKTFCLKNRETL